VNQFVSVIDAVKTGRPVAFFGALASDFRAVGYTVSTLAKIAMGKALRKKLV
jgi:hypothetical protein